MVSSAPRLNLQTLSSARAGLELPPYDLTAVRVGVVHFGPGAFHRAHQADVFDRMLVRDPRWGVCAVSLRHGDLQTALGPQDGLYVLAELGDEVRLRVIGAIREILVAPDPVVFERLAAPTTRVVTLTVTEKGYCLTPGGDLDLAHPDIRQDIATPEAPLSVIGYLVEGLRRRRETGTAPFVTVSCDNLMDNGAKLRRAVVALAGVRDIDLSDWIADVCAFPSTMVDSITPATDEALRDLVTAETGLHDAWPVQREVFTQWVIEDVGDPALSSLAAAGVILTPDVRGYEQAKLKLLNGPHSTLAYVGLLRGHQTVADAMTDAPLAAFVREMMLRDILPHVAATPGLNLARYVEEVLERFRNPAIRHNLSQIAWDGSLKLQHRLIGTVQAARQMGQPLSRLVMPFAAWMRFVRRRAEEGGELVDPIAETLRAIAATCTGEAADIDGFLALDLFPPALAADPGFRAVVAKAYLSLPELPN